MEELTSSEYYLRLTDHNTYGIEKIKTPLEERKQGNNCYRLEAMNGPLQPRPGFGRLQS